MPMIRFDDNPLIAPADVKPSRPDFEVVCVFNAGAIRFAGEVLLLLRVAERPRPQPGELLAPMLCRDDPSEGIELLRVRRGSSDVEEIDSRVFKYQGSTYLTSISHLRLARSKDGRNFTVADTPAVFPACREEEFGIEDPRITQIGDRFYINYSAISRMGISTGLAATRDFVTYERMGIIFVPDNRDVTVFPEKIGGLYVCYHRPVSGMFGRADMWLATSPDLLRWGDHKYVAGTRSGTWDCQRIGGGAVPFRTSKGWLEIYHGVDATQRYCLGAMLADGERPERIIARSPVPVLSPEAPYEREGFFGNVVFTCGAVTEPDGRVIVYYGAADWCVAAVETTIDDLLASVR